MRPSNKEIAKIVLDTFIDTFSERNKGELKNNNPLRSSYFVSLIGERIHKTFFTNSKLNIQKVSSVNSKSKTSGEWIYDICITSQQEITDSRYKGTSFVNTNILFACESEFETSIAAFATDFGKLLCSNANQILYIQGLSQSTEQGRLDFIESRKKIVTTQLNNLIKDDFVLAFIPTPGKIRDGSFWDTHHNTVIAWAEIWIYDKSKNEFFKFNS